MNGDHRAGAQSRGHDINPEEYEDPSEDAGKVAGSHPHRAAERVVTSNENRCAAQSDQQNTGPEIFIVADPDLHSKVPLGAPIKIQNPKLEIRNKGTTNKANTRKNPKR